MIVAKRYLVSAWCVLLALILMVPLVFSELAHAVVPHDHLEGSNITIDMHAAFVHEESVAFVAVTLYTTLVSLVALGAFLLWRLFSLQALLIRAGHKRSQSLRRGIVPFRKFR